MPSSLSGDLGSEKEAALQTFPRRPPSDLPRPEMMTGQKVKRSAVSKSKSSKGPLHSPSGKERRSESSHSPACKKQSRKQVPEIAKPSPDGHGNKSAGKQVPTVISQAPQEIIDVMSEGSFSPDYLESMSEGVPSPAAVTPPVSPSHPRSSAELTHRSSTDHDIQPCNGSSSDDPAPPVLSLEANLVLLTTVKKLAVVTGQMQESLTRSADVVQSSLQYQATSLARLEKKLERQERQIGRLSTQVAGLVNSLQWEGHGNGPAAGRVVKNYTRRRGYRH